MLLPASEESEAKAAMATTSEVAKLLGVSPPTIRTYTQKFGQHLSSEANPAPGQQRSFTDDDVAALTAARALLQEGLTYGQANDRLPAIDLSGFAPPTQQRAQEPLATTDTIRLVVEPYIQERDRVLAERDAALARIGELEREVGELTGRLAVVTRPWWQRLLGR